MRHGTPGDGDCSRCGQPLTRDTLERCRLSTVGWWHDPDGHQEHAVPEVDLL